MVGFEIEGEAGEEMGWWWLGFVSSVFMCGEEGGGEVKTLGAETGMGGDLTGETV